MLRLGQDVVLAVEAAAWPVAALSALAVFSFGVLPAAPVLRSIARYDVSHHGDAHELFTNWEKRPEVV
jgi:hypothetical protein